MGEKTQPDSFVCRVEGSTTNHTYSVIELEVPPKGGPPTHTHLREDEHFFVLEGVFHFWFGDSQPQEVGRHGSILGRRNISHRFENVGESMGKLLIVCTPAGLENYFRELTKARAELKDQALLEREKAIDQGFGIQINRPNPTTNG